MKQAVVEVVGRCMRLAPLKRTMTTFFSRRIGIFLYHGVWPAGSEALRVFGGMALDRFEDELSAFKRYFEFVTLSEILEAPRRIAARQPLAALTFDDGFDLTAGGATEVLDRLGIPATIFVNTASVRYERAMWQHKLQAIRAMRGAERYLRALNQVVEKTGLDPIRDPQQQLAATRRWPAARKDEYVEDVWRLSGMGPSEEFLAEHRIYFDWPGLRDWMARGHRVGFHSDTHPFCSALDDAEVESELVAPLDEIRANLGVTEVPFAYPFGDRLPPDAEARLAGRRLFSCLLGTSWIMPGRSDPNRLDRIDAELGLNAAVFGWPVVMEMKRRLMLQ